MARLIQEAATTKFTDLAKWKSAAEKKGLTPTKKAGFWSAIKTVGGRDSSFGQFTPRKSEGWLSNA